ncbi:MCE family protein [Conexibacter sp. W3-3-2]|uniref:MlaD family protein n=1 Tax=Conexibacter sp. W3-3-2 TaxID=2675227 RepID=UPI0012B8B142|nr:MlaD family protein [Conexibacter sp. W3-3-2]MTD44373.1 MCE family protein [Conexibacter sp. W3-3-2]
MSRRRRPVPAGRALAGPRPRLGRLAVVLQALVALALAAFLLAQQDPRMPWDDSYEVRVELRDASGLSTEDRNRVTIAGVPAGRVDEVRHDPERGVAVATLRLDGDTAGRLHAGTRATVQPRSALNDLVLDLTPGRLDAPALLDGDRIPVTRAAGATQLDQVLETLDADTRSQLQLLLAGLDEGLGDARGGRVAAALRQLDPVRVSGGRVARTLAERRVLLRRLVGGLDTLTGALAARADALERAVGAGRRTVAVSAARDAEIAAAVDRLPGTLADVRAALDGIQRLAEPLDPALVRLRPVARALPGALDALRDSTPATRALLGELRRTARQTRTASRTLRVTLQRLGPAATALEPAVRDAAPTVAAIDRNRDGIGLLGERFTGIFSTNDVNGPILRGLGFFETFNPANFGFSATTPAARLRAGTQVVAALTKVCAEQNPLACLVRYLVPGLPGAVRTAADPLGALPRKDRP